MFSQTLRLLAAGACALVLSTGASLAECKPALSESGEPSVSRSLVAQPTSFFAWKRAARAKYGVAFDNWSSAQERRIDCKQDTIGGTKRWICTRTALPCDNAGARPELITATRLELRDNGAEVRKLQEWLNLHGAKLEVDGNFGSGTVAAVKEFQKREGLKEDGIVGQATIERLQS